MLKETSSLNVIVKGKYFKIYSRVLQIHHKRINKSIDLRRGSFAPQKDEVLNNLYRSKSRARTFNRFCNLSLRISNEA